MNIAVIGIRGLPANYGGFETCAEHVTKFWSEEGHNVVIYCRYNHYKEHLKSYNGCRLKYIKSINTKSLDTLSHTLFCIFDLIFREPDIKNIHLYNAGNAMFLPILKLFKKNVIISVDGIEWKRQKWGRLAKIVHKLGEKFSVKYADEVIVDNTAVENYYRSKYGAETKMIPYGAKIIDINNYSYENEILKKYNLTEKHYFIFIGRLVPEKGVHTLIEVYKKLNTEIPMVIVGDDNPQSEYRNKLLTQRSDKIMFLGYIYGKEYESLLKNALIYITASELEGTSPSLLAAMGAKVCVLVNGIEENLYTIRNAGNFYKANDLEDFYRVWTELIKNRNLISEKAKMGFELVLNVYIWENIAKAYIDAFKLHEKTP